MDKLAHEYIEAEQKNVLIGLYGLNFEIEFNKKYRNTYKYFSGFERFLSKKDYAENEQIDAEVFFKNYFFENQSSFTKFDYIPHKCILNWISSLYLSLNAAEKIKDMPFLGTTFAKGITARIYKPEELDKPIVLYNGGQLFANLLLSKMFCFSIPFEFRENNDKVLIHTKRDEVFEYLFRKDSQNLRIILVDFLDRSADDIPGESWSNIIRNSFYEGAFACLLESISLFVFSHEMAHYELDHPLTTEGYADEELRSQEFDCDNYALNQIMKLYQQQTQNCFTLLGPAVWLHYQTLIEKANPSLAKDATHPDAIDRLDKYKKQIMTIVGEENKQELNTYFDLATNIFLVYESLLLQFQNYKRKLTMTN